MKVVQFPRDPHSGQVRVAMDGTTVSNPIAWAVANGDISQRYHRGPAERRHGH